jgi:hypothetical protein
MTASLDDVLPLSDLADVDRRISAAFSELGVARSRFADSPSGESLTACVAAEAALDELLDRRLALTSG